LRDIDCKQQRGGVVIKEVLNAKNSIDQCTIPEYRNESLVKAKPEPTTRLSNCLHGLIYIYIYIYMYRRVGLNRYVRDQDAVVLLQNRKGNLSECIQYTHTHMQG